MSSKAGDLWNRLFEMSERLMDRSLTEGELRGELARMDGLYKVSKSVIDLTNAVTRARVIEKSEGLRLPAMFTDMGEGFAPGRADVPDEPGFGRRRPLLPGMKGDNR